MRERKTLGLAAVTGSYVLWGFLTIFWSFLSQANSVYILAHRVIWSLVFMGGCIWWPPASGGEVVEAFRSRQTMLNCLLCGILITLNWGVYIYAVNSGHVLQASLGYFIEPVVVALIGGHRLPGKAHGGGDHHLPVRGGGHRLSHPAHGDLPHPGPAGGGALCRLQGAEEAGDPHRPDLPVRGDLMGHPGGAALLRVVDGPGGGARRRLWGARPSGSSRLRGGHLCPPAPV